MTLVFLVIILGLGAAVKSIAALLVSVSSLPLLLAAMGITGLIAITAAVTLGVGTSIQISIGREGARHSPSFAWWVISRLAFFVGTTNLSGFALYFMQARLGLPGEAAAGPATRLMMIVGVLILLFALPSGWLADRFGRKRLVAVSGMAAAVGTTVVILSPDFIGIAVGGCIIGAAAGTFFTTSWAMGTDLVPKAEAGRYLGISNLAGAGAGAIGAYIGGPLADYFTVRVPTATGIGYMLIFAIYAALFLLSAVAVLNIHESG
jgi:MFS family permease